MQESGQFVSAFGSTRKSVSILLGIILIASLQVGSRAQAQSSLSRITFANSIKEPVTATTNAPVDKNVPTVVRSQLTDTENQATIDFSIALKMRNFAEF